MDQKCKFPIAAAILQEKKSKFLISCSVCLFTDYKLFLFSHPFLNQIECLRGGRRVVVVLLSDGGLHAAVDDLLVGSLLEVDEDADGDLADEDDDQEHEELKKQTKSES